MSSTPREIGTLIVVILKARNLPNKRHIGKQDPYCSVSLNGEKRRTKAIKRGGQHPEWDEEVRFTLYEDVEDELARTAHSGDTPPLPPPKNVKNARRIKGGKSMRLCCFADDPREPDLIGEASVDLTEVLTKGETDEWFTLMNKEKYCGEVYLELTFWSNEAPPVKKATQKAKSNNQYGGAGSFVPLDDVSSSLLSGPEAHTSTSRIVSGGSEIHRDMLPPSLRTSSSAAQISLYIPPYERNRPSPAEGITSDFGELNLSEHHSRENLSLPNGGYTPRPLSSAGFSSLPTHPSHGYEHSSYSEEIISGVGYEQHEPSLTPTVSVHRNTISGPAPTFSGQSSYPNPYDSVSSNYGSSQIPPRRPRYSVPASSSGFVPIPTSNTSSFTRLPSYASEPSGFVTHTPVPNFDTPTPYPLSHTPLPSHSTGVSALTHSLPRQPSISFQQLFPSSQSYEYPPYPTPASAPPHQYIPPQPPSSAPPSSHSAPPQPYPTYAPATPPQEYVPGSATVMLPSPSQSYSSYSHSTPSPPHDHLPPAPPILGNNASFQSTSRPLPPQPTGHSLPPSGNFAMNPYASIPPPPPLPQNHRRDSSPHSYSVEHGASTLPPPPPLPSAQTYSSTPSGRPSLPQPPANHIPQGQPIYQPIPPPPPPPTDPSQFRYPPPPPQVVNHSQSFYPGPPPRPPAQNYPQSVGQSNWN